MTAVGARVTMRVGVRLAIDVGTVRVGVATSDPSGVLATPLTVVRRDRHRQHDLDEIAALASQRQVVEVLVGLPRSLSGGEGPAAAAARVYATAVARRVAPVPVRLVDERLSTVSATRDLRAAGMRGRAARAVVDAAAAVVFLQAALDTERATGVEPGEPVQP